MLVHALTGESMHGRVCSVGEDGVWLRRSDEYGNALLLDLAWFSDEDYIVKEINGTALH